LHHESWFPAVATKIARQLLAVVICQTCLCARARPLDVFEPLDPCPASSAALRSCQKLHSSDARSAGTSDSYVLEMPTPVRGNAMGADEDILEGNLPPVVLGAIHR
jgi:hypothetical protein